MRQALILNHACVKTLSAVETEPSRSNQHELNGVSQLKSLFGTARQSISANFSIRGEAGFIPVILTWYDAREAHPTRSEYRLYFPTNTVMAQAQEGSTLVFGSDNSGQFWGELIR
ncbi:hypothetical protein OW492_07845 [Psychromonas sp. 14N.309.X.WAT.B.A12]|uniref:hypothetical protein n=1 Tax=Psychromonas sp. 14N.309.X.WAT.B.A12 TaxID=2998322 RepID=UPI0025B083C1|nr:hypothetical protein [Psychromonas sp. 14N.309.X.WAT.B.A12]MDN2663285.1 hypothetical protein [Psychromonas sp. 14N.309.X.WAT.B.A12]